jgi:2-keto-3-deoxy-L-rhamnonate aldolase RhmA
VHARMGYAADRDETATSRRAGARTGDHLGPAMNPFRQLLKSSGSHPPIGTWITSASPLVAEAVGHAGFDWGVVDMEHTPLDLMDVIHMLQAVAATKMVPVVRVPWNEPVMVKRVLDAGAQTLLFPFVQSADEARRAVAATRYPPQGIRGMSSMSRGSRFGTNPNYVNTANASIGVIVQLETAPAVAQLDAIAAVEGIDAIFLGPADLSASMGHVGQPTHPAVMDLMSKAAHRCRELGMPCGTVGGTPDVVARYRAAEFSYLAIASDIGLMMRSAQNVLHAMRTPGEDHVHTLQSGTQEKGSQGY